MSIVHSNITTPGYIFLYNINKRQSKVRVGWWITWTTSDKYLNRTHRKRILQKVQSERIYLWPKNPKDQIFRTDPPDGSSRRILQEVQSSWAIAQTSNESIIINIGPLVRRPNQRTLKIGSPRCWKNEEAIFVRTSRITCKRHIRTHKRLKVKKPYTYAQAA